MHHEDLPGPVSVGGILAGKYRIDGILGAGGMGVVVAAHHVQLDERVALKFLLPAALANPEAVARFTREARAAVKIKSEHVARVSDVGTLETGAPYMVMEYLEGSDLASWLERQGPLPLELAVELVLQACEAIAEAHMLGIVHRDLKPANLFVIRRPDGALSVKVLDFGISKNTGLGASGGSMTGTAAIMGSPYYMSPEQLRSSRDVDPRTDIWALGVILQELVTGKPPFYAETMPELVLNIVSSDPVPVQNLRPDVPPRFAEVIARCLQKDRQNRYATIAELALALIEFAPRRGRTSLERISGVMHASALSAGTLGLAIPSERPSDAVSAAGTAASWGQTHRPAPRKQSIVRLAAALGVALLGGGVWLGFSGAERVAEMPVLSATLVQAPARAVEPLLAPRAQASSMPASAAQEAAPPSSASTAPPLPKLPRRSTPAPRPPKAPPPKASAVTAGVSTAPEAPKRPSLDALIDERR